MTDHPTITPPPELVQKWFDQAELATNRIHCIATRAAQWGADQELEECCAWFVRDWTDVETADKLRAARRPKPQTLSSIALQTLDTIERDAHYLPEITDTIRRAILRLKQLEDSNG